ncbi:MAG: hypothetical protein PHZ04_05215 [Patescibacteria group bacterium]|nr:hypothetical protein [Patescibacteria group bacterium]MDD5294815.1 hypothetical protein [Patescibacteria group bacterium]MDD5554551.1 hypothetical protein [Patescibacteria group bacterium]
MFGENADNTGGFKERKEDDMEKEVEERLERLFVFMEEICGGLKEATKKVEFKDLYLNSDKIFTQERVEKMFAEVEEISDLAKKCERKDVFDMLTSLRYALHRVNYIYEKGYLNDFDENARSNELFNIMRAMKVLVGAKEYFTKEKEGGE